ncbi:hypothetical protein RQP46_007542 [Phenoliferia psychrophenolica]
MENLVLIDLNLEGLKVTAKETGLADANLLVKQVNITSDTEVEALFADIEAKFGRLDYAVNAAGVSGRTQGGLVDIPQEDFDFVMDVNIRSMAVLCRQQIKLMLKNKRVTPTSKIGSIVNFGSWSSTHGHAATPHYTASKFAVAGLTKCLCASYASKGLRVNGVAPGVIETPMLAPQYRNSFNVDMIPQGRLGQPEEIADTVLFLMSDRATFINGIFIPVDGGSDAL